MALCALRRDHVKSERPGGGTLSHVIRDQALELVSQLERDGQVKRVEAPQLVWVDRSRPVACRTGHAEQREGSKYRPSLGHLFRSTTPRSSQELGSQEIARHDLGRLLAEP